MSFPQGFIWGAAASSYQIEGGAREDGKGLSVWDEMCRQPGKVWSGNTGDVAGDHYHRYEEDARLMGEIGLQAYRLSVSWPRVLPDGVGQVNAKGLEFYDKLIDVLLANHVEPWVTLFHWDFPLMLYRQGGWLNRDSADWFGEYAQVLAEKVGDRVTRWMTHNEPQCFIGLGHQSGQHAPGLKLSFADVLLASHHALMAHGKAVQAIRAHSKLTPSIGAAPVGHVKIPASDAPEDIDAARRATFSVAARNCWNNTWFADPMVLGRYPEDGVELFGEDMPAIQSGDMETINQSLDFYGVNIYHDEAVRAGKDGAIENVPWPVGFPLTMMDWPVTPEALYWGPRFLQERYKLPVVITENGMANTDWVHLDGKVHDPQRIDFLTRYMRECHRAMTEGVRVDGYFVWSIMDNFEWAEGYRKRFGLIHIDYATGQRTLKDSAYWYKEVIRSNGDILF
ncbi:beta-glucosidase [Candidatus Sumerlaeota bacterium]|nr:beta-glucosidase [Candidatus Sumerlaeota bacterium]